MIKRISFSFVLLALILFLNTSCEKWLDVNTNIDAPTAVDGYLYLAGIQQAYQGTYYDVRATAPLTQMMGTSSFTQFANHYYFEGSDNGGETWRYVYWLQGMNLENLINQSVTKEQWTLAGIGLAMKAYSWDQMTKLNGELILRDAFVPGLLSHRYDYQDSVYAQVRRWAYKAIEYLQKADANNYGTLISANDYIYKGDKAKWIKFAYGVLVRNLSSLSNKSDFLTKYAPELITCATNSFASIADDATLTVGGGGQSAAQSAYNNFWGTFRGNLAYSYWQHEYAVQVFTGTVPKYDVTTGNKIPMAGNVYYPYELAVPQITADTIISVAGHYDPRVAVKLATTDDPSYNDINYQWGIKKRKYYGGTFTGTTGPVGVAPTFYGRTVTPTYSGSPMDGSGRWLYRDNAPYILMTYAELQFCLAECYWKMSQKTDAYNAFKRGVQADMDFTVKYLTPGTAGKPDGGDKITTAAFNALAAQYVAGPYVNGLLEANLTLSHIMMQKWIAMYPWGASETWVDMRKYHYDIAYTGEYPKSGNGWDLTNVDMKWDTDPTKVYKGLYLAPAEVQGRRSTYNVYNEGSPCYRIRPRYNSEYMWNKPSLSELKPIAGTALNYQCSIPWFAYPGNYPTSK